VPDLLPTLLEDPAWLIARIQSPVQRVVVVVAAAVVVVDRILLEHNLRRSILRLLAHFPALRDVSQCSRTFRWKKNWKCLSVRRLVLGKSQERTFERGGKSVFKVVSTLVKKMKKVSRNKAEMANDGNGIEGSDLGTKD
jgi:hypothetical protein